MKLQVKNPYYLISGVIGISLYLISTGLSFAMFRYVRASSQAGLPGDQSQDQNHFVIDPSLPRTEPCPLNGKLYTKQEREIWEGRRPLAVMVENHAEARPQSGLSSADVVYEAVAEGGITRFLAIYYCAVAAQPVNISPVRSARTYYLPWVLEYDALYNHVGGAGRCNDPTVDNRAKALCQIDTYKIKDMDQFGISFPTCYRNYDRLDHTVATEHTMVCVTDKLYDLAKQRGWTNVDGKGIPWDASFDPYSFKDDAKGTQRGASMSASFVAWKGYESLYGVRWEFDPATNSYQRYNGGVLQTDLESGQVLSAKAVVILFAREIGPVDEHVHLLYNNIGVGEGIILQDGQVVKITWRKPQRTSRTTFYDSANKEVQFNRGQLWIEMLPIGTEVTY